MNFKTTAAAASFACALAVGGAASAAQTVTLVDATDGRSLPAGFTLITGFESDAAEGGNIIDLADGFTFTQDALAYTRLGSLGLASGVSAPPPGVTDHYETVLGGGKATLTSVRGLRAFSFYLGSPDGYNTVSFKFTDVDGTVTTLSGENIWGGTVYNGNQGVGKTVVYKFGPAAVKSIEFSSSGNSFEFDHLGGLAVPEPGTWALMILGFGGAGAMLRRRRTIVAA